MTLKNNRVPLLCCFQLCAWFHCHMWIQTGVKSPETAKLGVDLCDLDLWPLTLTFCMDITSYHGNNSWKFQDDTMMGTWWTRQIWGIWKLRPAYSPQMPNLGQIRRFLELCDLEIWRMTLKNNRASLLCCFKICATFHSHWCIETWVTVRKRTIWVKIDDFFSRVTLQIDRWPWKTIGHLF